MRRARESAGGAPLSPPPPQRHPPEPASPGSSFVSDREPDRWLIAAVAVVTVLVVAAAIGLGVSLANGTGPRGTATLPSPVTTPGHAGPARPAHHPIRDGRWARCRVHPCHHDDHGAGGGPGRRAGHLRAQSLQRHCRGERPGRRLELPQLERPDRRHIQRSGGRDELPHAEHLYCHRPGVVGLSVRTGDHHHCERHFQCGDLHLPLNVFGRPQRLGLAAPCLREEPEECGRGRRGKEGEVRRKGKPVPHVGHSSERHQTHQRRRGPRPRPTTRWPTPARRSGTAP